MTTPTLTVVQQILILVGLWTCVSVLIGAGWAAVARLSAWRARRRETQAVVDELIRESRVASRWIIAEPKGRG